MKTFPIMKKILLSLLVLGFSGQLVARTFTATGAEPFWGIELKPIGDDSYQAILSLPALSETSHDVTATVKKYPHKDYVTYEGADREGKNLSVMLIRKACSDETKGDTWSHVVRVAWGDGYLDGCGGEVISGSNNQRFMPLDTQREKAKEFNTKGFRLYKKGSYYQALSYFYRATQVDKSYVLGQYNLACTASILLNNFDCSQDDSLLEIVNPNAIFMALRRAIDLDHKRKEKSLADPDLALVRKSYRYYRDILGYSANNKKEFHEMLENIAWTQAAGFYAHHGQPATLNFNRSAGLVVSSDNKGLKKLGTYFLRDGGVELIFNSKKYGDQQIFGRLIDNDGVFDGVLHFEGAVSAHVLPFDDYRFIFPSPCEVN